jgi:hypothetical protein
LAWPPPCLYQQTYVCAVQALVCHWAWRLDVDQQRHVGQGSAGTSSAVAAMIILVRTLPLHLPSTTDAGTPATATQPGPSASRRKHSQEQQLLQELLQACQEADVARLAAEEASQQADKVCGKCMTVTTIWTVWPVTGAHMHCLWPTYCCRLSFICCIQGFVHLSVLLPLLLICRTLNSMLQPAILC